MIETVRNQTSRFSISSVLLLSCLAAYILFSIQVPALACWDKAAGEAVRQIELEWDLNWIQSQAPRGERPTFLLPERSGDCYKELEAKLTEYGYRLVSKGNFPRLELICKRTNNLLHERPFAGYLIELRLLSKEGAVYESIRGKCVKPLPAPWQLVWRPLVLFVFGGMLFFGIRRASLHHSRFVWVLAGFMWLLLAAILLQGYFWPGLFL